MKKEKRVLAAYLILVFVLSAPIEAIWIYYGEAASGIGSLLMIVPAIAALALKLVYYRKQRLLGFCIGKPIYYLLAAIIPLIYIGLSYSLYWLFVPGTFAGTSVLVEIVSNAVNVQNIPAAMLIGLGVSALGSILMGLGEEIGWRGLMYPTMHKLWGRNKALIVSGVIWAVWHLPVLISGNYMSGASILYRAPMFIVEIIAITVVVSWLRMKSNSIWPAAIWHGLHNFLDQVVFTSMTNSESGAYFVSETGIITVLFSILFAVLILVFGKFKKADE